MSPVSLFNIKGIPVSVSPLFLLFGYFGYLSGGLWGAITQIVVIFVSLLVHELGHALIAKKYKLAPAITLHALGGTTSHQRPSSDREEAWIVAAGPFFGLCLGILCFLILRSSLLRFIPINAAMSIAPILSQFVYINFFWTAFNLFPLWPLDGGQLFRLGLVRWLGPKRGENITHVLGAALGITCALIAYFGLGHSFLGIMCGWLAFDNIMRIGSTRASGAIRFQGGFSSKLFKDVESALQRKDNQEALRLAHQLKSDGSLSGSGLERVFEILVITSSKTGADFDAIAYARRARKSKEMVQAVHESALRLNDQRMLEELETPAWKKYL